MHRPHYGIRLRRQEAEQVGGSEAACPGSYALV